MHIGAHVEIIGQGVPFGQAFPMIKALGAEGVELVMREGAQLDLHSKDADFLRAAGLAADMGLKISGLTAGYTWSLPMTSGDESIRAKGYQALLRQMEGAKLLGTDSLLIVPGYVSTIFFPSAEKVEVPVALDRAREAIIKALETAASLRVSLNIEDVWNGMLRNPHEMAAFLDGFRNEWTGVYLDVANVYPQSDPVTWIRVLGKRIRRVHMKDYHPARQGLEAFCELGTGCVDFHAVMAALRDSGYDGWIGAEHHVGRTPKQAAHTLRYLNSLRGI